MAAFEATARLAEHRHPLDPARLARDARARARELWRAAPTYPYCLRVGISSWEGLWCRFDGDDPSVRALRSWAPTYRRSAWRLALADQTRARRRSGRRARRVPSASIGARRHEAFPDARGALTGRPRRSHRLGPGHQRRVLPATREARGIRTRRALRTRSSSPETSASASPTRVSSIMPLTLLDGDPREATMVGDSLDARRRRRDRRRAPARSGSTAPDDPDPTDRPAVTEIATLGELAAYTLRGGRA